MKPKNIILTVSLAAITAIVISMMSRWVMFSYDTVIIKGPIPLLRLLHYGTEERRIAFPQWINNEEICYLEIVLHADDYGGSCRAFMKIPLTDIYIYREKAGYPETKRIIKHIARQDIEPYSSLEGSLDKNLGLRVYNNGKNIFLYYTYSGYGPTNGYRYITMNINGGNIKEHIPKIIPSDTSEDGKIIPMDISQDGKKLYGIIKVNTLPDIYAIADYTIKTKKAKKLLDITDEKFCETRNAQIYDLKLVAKDKLILSYDTDCNAPNTGMYTYLVGTAISEPEFVEDIWEILKENDEKYNIFGDSTKILAPDRVYTMTKDEKYLISGNIGIYEKRGNGWIKIKDFLKRNPCISPNGKKILYYDILTEKGLTAYDPDYIYYTGEKLAVSDISKIFEEQK